jgi:hypothetical protein
MCSPRSIVVVATIVAAAAHAAAYSEPRNRGST